jgi:methionine synthase I (cobalamin-dependent)
VHQIHNIHVTPRYQQKAQSVHVILDTMTNKLQELIDKNGLLLADGATGTNLFAVGLQTGDAPELWNVDHPDRISQLHRSFVEAGSDIILTNSFGGTHYRLALHNAGHRVHELNKRAAELARAEADKADKTVLVAGSMGPTGEILAPNGPVSIDKLLLNKVKLCQTGAQTFFGSKPSPQPKK